VTGQNYSSVVQVPADHLSFAGHFPGQPILPGVLLLERVLALAQQQLAIRLEECLLINVKFLAPVNPGDRLRVDLSQTGANQYSFAVHVVQATNSEAVMACSGQFRTAPVPDGTYG
jgi:3-hydroxyacyl-[acyl-carrier-protein] dehydratase